MKKILFLLVLTICIGALCVPADAHAATMAERTAGKILLDVENNGEAWYVYPGNQRRYYLGRPEDAFDIMRFLSLGITDKDLARIPTNTETRDGDLALRERLSGWILLQVEQNGEAWYVYPTDKRRYFLDRPADAFDIMGNLGLGISTNDLNDIPIATDFLSVGTGGESFQSFTLTTPRGAFDVEVATIGRADYEMITDTGNTDDCDRYCAAYSLQDYVQSKNGFAGIHGSYFCPPDYSACWNSTYSFLSPVFNTSADKFINQDKLLFHDGPMIVMDTDGEYYFYHRTVDFGRSKREWEQEKHPGKEVAAAMSNYPSLVENGNVIVESEPLDAYMQTKAVRGGFGYNDDSVFMVIARSASVVDLGYIMESLGANWALNLDGGASASLFYDGQYKFQGGRLLPNAIIYKKK